MGDRAGRDPARTAPNLIEGEASELRIYDLAWSALGPNLVCKQGSRVRVSLAPLLLALPSVYAYEEDNYPSRAPGWPHTAFMWR